MISSLALELFTLMYVSDVRKGLKRCPAFMFAFLFFLLCRGIHYVDASRVDTQTVHSMEDQINSVIYPSSYSASSIYKNHEDSAARQAYLDVFSNDNTPRAWCPSTPVKDERREWLQVEFNEIKVVRTLITKGRGPKSGEYVPSFFMQYQRDDNQWHDYIQHNGKSLIVANNAPDVQSKPIQLSPTMVARRFRVFPYDEAVKRSMCFKLATFGHSFNGSVLDYEIPEGDVYRSPDGVYTASLNDSAYDGTFRSSEVTRLQNNDSDQPRAYLQGGLGVLMDRDYYLGDVNLALKPPFSARHAVGGLSNQTTHVVGWFCRSGLPPSSSPSVPCHSRNVTLTFHFDSVRQFSQVRIHTLNSHKERVSVFRRAVIQFSVGGKLYDRYGPPIVYEHQRDTLNLQARWVNITLGKRIGQYVTVTLMFDFDWIVLSEIAFESTAINEKIEEEKTGSDIHQSIPHVTLTSQPNLVHNPDDNRYPSHLAHAPPLASELLDDVERQDSPLMNMTNTFPLIIGFICVIVLIAFVTIIVFIYRIHNARRSRLKKKKKLRQLPTSGGFPAGSNTLEVQSENNTNNNNNMIQPTYCLANSGSGVTSTMAPKFASMDQNAMDMYATFNGSMRPEDMLAYNRYQQRAQNYDSSMSFASPISSLMLHPSAGMRYIDPYGETMQQQQGSGGCFSVDLSRQKLIPQLQHRVPSLVPISTASSPTSAALPSCGILGNSLVQPSCPTNGFYPPPPDQPLPPLPPATPVSSNEPGARHSTVNPYAASSLNGFLIDDAGMVTSTHTDGSLAEYASASLINGMPIRPPSICGIPPGYSYPGQENITSTSSNPLLLITNSGLNGAMLNNVSTAYRPVVLPSGQTGYIAAVDMFPQDRGWLPMNKAHTAHNLVDMFPQDQGWIPMSNTHNNSYNQQQCLLGTDFQKRDGIHMFSSDTLKSIDTLPRDSPKTGVLPFENPDVFENGNTVSQR